MDSVDIVHGYSGHCPWTQWILSMDSVDSLDIVHGHAGQSPGSPGGLDNAHGQSPLSPWTDWTLPMDSLGFVQYDLVKKTEVKVATLEIYIYIFLRKKIKLFELITSKQLIIHNI